MGQFRYIEIQSETGNKLIQILIFIPQNLEMI